MFLQKMRKTKYIEFRNICTLPCRFSFDFLFLAESAGHACSKLCPYNGLNDHNLVVSMIEEEGGYLQ